MAGNNARIKIDFLVNDKQLNAGFMRAWRRADTFGKRMDLIAGRMQSFGRSMSTYVTLPIVAGLTLATNAAIVEQQEMALLEQALKKNVKATDEQVAATERWVTKTQNWSGIADGMLRPALAALVRSTKDTGKAQELLGVAMDISVAKGKPLQTVADALAKAYGGNTAALGRLGIRMKDAEGNALSFEQVMARAKDTFGGAAAKAADTTAGKLAILKAKLADAAEVVGTSLIPMVEKGAEYISRLAGAFNRLSPGMKDFAVKAALVAAAVGPASWLAGGGIKVVLRLAEAYKAVAKWAGLAAAAQNAPGGGKGPGGKVPLGGGVPAVAGLGAGGVVSVAVVSMAAGVLAAMAVSRYGNADETRAGKLAARGVNPRDWQAMQRVQQGASGRIDRGSLNKGLLGKLAIRAQDATGPAFRKVMARYAEVKLLTAKGIDFKLDPKKPLASLQSLQARLMETGMSAGKATKVMERVFGKDVVAPLRRHMERLIPTMDGVKVKVTAAHAKMAAKLMQQVRMPAPDASGMLSVLNNIRDRMIALGYSAQQAADAIARAVSAAGHLKSGSGAGGRIREGSATGGIATGPMSGYRALLHGTEAIIPLNGMPYTPNRVVDYGGGKGGAGVIHNHIYLDGDQIAESIVDLSEDPAQASADGMVARQRQIAWGY